MKNQENCSLIDYHPLTATADTTVDVAIALISQNSTSYLVVLASPEPESPVVGLFTEREIIQLTASGVQLSNLSLNSVITKDLITINESALKNLFDVNYLLQKYQINYLPVVGITGNLIGIITQQSIQKHLLEAMNTKEIYQKLTALQNLVEQQATDLKKLNQQLQTTISYHQLAEKKIHTAEEKLRRVLAAMTDLLMVINLAEDQIKEVEILPTNLTSLPASKELVNHTLNNLYLPFNNPSSWLGKLQKSLTKKQVVNFDYQINLAKQEAWFNVSISPFLDNYVLWVARDITDRKQAEIALRESEAKFRAIFNQAIQFIALLQPDGMTLEINQTALDFAGITRDEVIDKPFWETKWWTISPETQSELKLAIAAAAEGAFMRYEVNVIDRENQIVTIDFSLRPICNQQGQVTLLIAEGRDISDRKFLEQKLAVREALLNAFFSSAPVGLCIVDEQFRYVKINQQLAEINGLPASEHISKNFSQVLPNIAASLVPLYQQILIKDEPTLNLEIKGEVPSQPGVLRDWIVSLFPIPGEDGNSRNVGAVVVEVTERKRAEKALVESAKRERALTQVIQKIRQTLELPEIFNATTTELRQLLDCDRVTIYRFHEDGSGEFVAESVADGWISLLAAQHQNPLLTASILNKEEYVSEKLNQLNVENRTTNYLAVANIYQSELTNYHIEILEQFQCKAYLTVPIFFANQFWGLLSVYQNSHPRQWQESEINLVLQIGAQLAVALQQAELLSQTQSQSLELMRAKEAADAANYAKSQFLAKMSHELRTPLNAILGFSQIMVRNKSVSSEQREHLEIINRSGEHLLNLINDILSMAKIESGQMSLNQTCFNLHQMLELLRDMFQLKAEQKGLELNFSIAPEVPQNIQTDESKLRQILLNLLGNAIKFTHNGYVTLTVFLTQVTAQDAEDVQIFFTVKDTGPGIDPNEIATLFQPFSQTQTGRQTGQGTGLGLAISQQFVKLMGGELIVESQLGIGSIFTFNICAKLAPETEKNLSLNHQQVISLEPNQPTYRILVVEDIKENRQLLVKLLQPLGFEVREAENGQEAVIIWESWQPHLIWMDMRMPVMDGYEATRQIKAHPLGKNTVIIALTASVFEEQQPAILAAGCNDFMPKPFRSEILLEKMAKYLGVRYTYADDLPPIAEHFQTPTLRPEDLKVMPQEWIAKLHQAAAAVDDQLVIEMLEEIPETYINLVNILTRLVENFRLDIILKITELCLKE